MTALNILIIAILLFKIWACFFNPAALFGVAAQGYEPAHVKALWELAGRNIAMVAVSLYALLRPSKVAYMTVLLMGLLREGADMIFAAGLPPESLQSVLSGAPFLLFIAAYFFGLQRLQNGDLRNAKSHLQAN